MATPGRAPSGKSVDRKLPFCRYWLSRRVNIQRRQCGRDGISEPRNQPRAKITRNGTVKPGSRRYEQYHPSRPRNTMYRSAVAAVGKGNRRFNNAADSLATARTYDDITAGWRRNLSGQAWGVLLFNHI